MLGARTLRTAVALAALTVVAAHATELLWPEYFAPPAEAEPPDSAAFAVGIAQNEYSISGRTSEGKDTLRWGIFDSAYCLRQLSCYSFVRNHGRQDQHLDLTGEYVRTTMLGRAMSLGLEWTPLLALVQYSNDTGWFQTNVDIGPVWRSSLLGVPLALHGGLSAKGWNNTVPEDFTMAPYADFHGAAGFYGGAEIGGASRLLPSVPLYANLHAFGRYVEDLGFSVVNGSVLYGQGIASGDSLFIYAADSLSDGLEGEGAGRSTRLTNTLWRVTNSLRVSAALKGASRLRLVPAVLYTLRQDLVTYPDVVGVPNDRKTTAHEVSALVETDTGMFFSYRGGIGFVVEDEDWLFRIDVPTTLTATNRDTIAKNNEDHRSTAAVMEHSLGVRFPHGMGLDYTYVITRHSDTYENACPALKNDRDEDRQQQTHDLTATLLRTERWAAHVSGQFRRDVLNYTKAQLSSANRTDRTYRIEAGLSYGREGKFSVGDVLSAQATVGEYAYPQVHQGPGNCPGYTRSFSSQLAASWDISEHWRIEGKWHETYSDDGSWYGAEYFMRTAGDTTHMPERLDYYAIQSKATKYLVELGVKYTPSEALACRLSASLEDIFQRDYDGSTYRTSATDEGYVLVPALGVRWTPGRWGLRLQAYIGRRINTRDEDIWSKESWGPNWDIKLKAGLEL